MSRLEMWQRVQKNTGTKIDCLTPPDLGRNGVYIWQMYINIFRGSKEVNWSIISDYQNTHNTKLTPWESDLMIDIEMIRRKHAN